jgi:predicted transcriptional regulator
MRFGLGTNIRKYFNIPRRSELHIDFEPDIHWRTGEEYYFLCCVYC